MVKRGRPKGTHAPWKKGNTLRRMLEENNGIVCNFKMKVPYWVSCMLLKQYRGMKLLGEPIIRIELAGTGFNRKKRSIIKAYKRIIYCWEHTREDALDEYFKAFPEDMNTVRKGSVSSAILDGDYSKYKSKNKGN